MKWTGAAGERLSHRWAAQHVQKPFVPAPCQAPGAKNNRPQPRPRAL